MGRGWEGLGMVGVVVVGGRVQGGGGGRRGSGGGLAGRLAGAGWGWPMADSFVYCPSTIIASLSCECDL